MANDWFQWGLFFLSGYTIYLVSEKRYARASVVGLVSELFWLGSSYTSDQWSVFLLTFWYTWCYWKMFQDNKKIIIKRSKEIWNFLSSLWSH